MSPVWLWGASIFPVSYLLTVFIKFTGGKGNVFEPPESIPLWILTGFYQGVLRHYWGIDLAHLDAAIRPLIQWIFLVFFFLSNTLAFVLIITLLPKTWRPVVIVVVYMLFLIINCYIPECDM